MVCQLNETNIDRLKIKFRIAHAIGKQGRPYTDYIWLCKLHERNGLDVGTSYINDKAAHTFVEYVSEVERLELVNSLKTAKFITLLSDGTTDSAVCEQEIVYVRYCVDGDINVRFLGLQQVERADAEGITNAIKLAASEQGGMTIEQLSAKLVGFGSDGASVMVGKKGGVVAHLKKIQPAIQAVHCYANRLELAYKDALSKLPLYIKVDELLHGLYKFYHKSSLARSMLKRSFDMLNLSYVVPTRVGGTRWMPHTLRAITNLWKGYPAILAHMQQVCEDPGGNNLSGDRKAKAKHYLKALLDMPIIHFAHILNDAVIVLSKLSLDIQRSACTVGDIHLSVMATLDVLEKYSTKPGPMFESVVASDEFFNHKLQGGSRTDMEKVLKDVMTNLKCKLQGRFDDINVGILNAARIATLKMWPDNGEYTEFGDKY